MTLEERREELKRKQAAYVSNMAAEKAKFMRDLDGQDLVAEEQAEKQRIKMLKENDLYDKQE